MGALSAEVSEMERQVKEAERSNRSLRSRTKELMEELEARRALVEAGQKESRSFLREQEVDREEVVQLTGHRYRSSCGQESE